MRYPAAEKLEIIRLVEQSHLPTPIPPPPRACRVYRTQLADLIKEICSLSSLSLPWSRQLVKRRERRGSSTKH